MAQHDYVISNGTGAAVRSDLNNALAAIVSQNSGATAPSPTYAFQFWADTTAGVLKLRNSANSAWITLFQLDGEWTTLPVENGTAAAPSIYFKDSGTDTGFYSPGTDQVAISTGGTGRLFINSSGSVGIGSSAPQVALQLGNYSGNNQLAITSGSASGTGALFFGDGTGADLYRGYIQYYHVNDSIEIATAGTGRLTIDSSGRCGIGTTSPEDRLDLGSGYLRFKEAVGGTGTYGAIRAFNTLANTNPATSIRFIRDVANVGNDGAICFDTVNSERARIDSSGRLLVGTSTAPTVGVPASATFVVQGYAGVPTGDSLISLQRGQAPASISSGSQLGAITFGANDGSPYAQIHAATDGTGGTNDYPGRLVFSTTADGASSPTERLRIANNGSWGLAGANYGTSGQVLTSNGSGSAPTWQAASGGKILQVVSTTKTDTFSTASSTYIDITGLSVTITPSSTSSKILLIASVTAINGSGDNVFLRLVRDSTAISLGDAAGSRVRATAGSLRSSDSGAVGSFSINFLDSPSLTSAITYKIQTQQVGTTTYVNRSPGDDDANSRGRYTSTITAIEVAA